MWTLQRTCTSKEKRVFRALKEPVAFRACRALMLFLGSKERRGLWDFLDSGGVLESLVHLVRKVTKGNEEAPVSQV